MSRLVLIHDELNGKYRVVTGDSTIEVVLQQTVKRGKAGYSKILDKLFPISQQAHLDLGASANVILTIECDSNTDRWINERQKQLFTKILNDGVSLIKNHAEEQVSEIKSRTAYNNGMSPLDLNRILAIVFPEIIDSIHRALDVGIRELLPFLTIQLHRSLNLSNQIDRFIEREYEQDKRGKFEIWQAIVLHKLETPYDPQMELDAVREHYEKLIQNWPAPSKPALGDLEDVYLLIQEKSGRFERNLLGKTQPNIAQKIFSLLKK